VNHDDDTTGDPRESGFVRLAAGIGDLANPFYREERQRDVWNEASAVAFQLLLWAGMAAATAMVWIGGADGLPYGLALMLLLGAASWVGIAYAAHLGVRVDTGTRLLRARTVPYVVLVLAFAAGAVRTGVVAGPFGWGVGAGALVGVLAGVLGLRRARRLAGA
jgi:hypothetical protein